MLEPNNKIWLAFPCAELEGHHHRGRKTTLNLFKRRAGIPVESSTPACHQIAKAVNNPVPHHRQQTEIQPLRILLIYGAFNICLVRYLNPVFLVRN